MKAFHFRLEQALRWRATQVDVEKFQVSVAANRLASIRTTVESWRKELADSVPHLNAGTTGSALDALAVWTERTHRQILEFEKKAREAESDLAARMRLLVETNRKMRLLENLKRTGHARWQSEFSRELEAFASEAANVRCAKPKRGSDKFGTVHSVQSRN